MGSLSNIDLNEIPDSLIIGCNWVFLHDEFDQIDERLIICLSDPFFITAEPELWIYPLNRKNCKILIPASWSETLQKLSSQELEFKNRIITYDLEGHPEDEREGNEIFNLQNFPKSRYTSSVMTTACLPLAQSLANHRINIFGVDLSYYSGENEQARFNPYFFKYDKKYGYKHTKNSADIWSKKFEFEFTNQVSYLRELGLIINLNNYRFT